MANKPSATLHRPTLEAVLRGLRSEDDSTQLRAIIASVEAMLPSSQSETGGMPGAIYDKHYVNALSVGDGPSAQSVAAETPRTDVETYIANDPGKFVPDFEYVDADFARQLERELADFEHTAAVLGETVMAQKEQIAKLTEMLSAPSSAAAIGETCEHNWSRPAGFSTQKCNKCGIIESLPSATREKSMDDMTVQELQDVIARVNLLLHHRVLGDPLKGITSADRTDESK